MFLGQLVVLSAYATKYFIEPPARIAVVVIETVRLSIAEPLQEPPIDPLSIAGQQTRAPHDLFVFVTPYPTKSWLNPAALGLRGVRNRHYSSVSSRHHVFSHTS